MHKRIVSAGVGLLVLAGALAVVPFGDPTPLKTGSLYPNADPNMVACYTSGVSGDLVDDPVAGTAIIDEVSHKRTLVTWPIGFTARRSVFGVSVIDRQGHVVARTGTWVNLSGGYWLDNSFLACTSY
jgi:hypothetical protein